MPIVSGPNCLHFAARSSSLPDSTSTKRLKWPTALLGSNLQVPSMAKYG